MIDMSMGNQDGIDLANQVSAITQQMNTGLTGVHEEVFPCNY